MKYRFLDYLFKFLFCTVVFSVQFFGHAGTKTPDGKREGSMNVLNLKHNRGIIVKISTGKMEYRLNDKIKLEVLIKNTSSKEVFIYNELDWGESSSFSLWVKDVRTGKDVVGQYLADALPPPPSSKDQFTKLAPGYSFGFESNWMIKEINIDKPGDYLVEVVYHSPVPTEFAFGLPIWSTEMGRVESNAVKIHVTP
ncbi:MAG: hypothetical protein WAT51_04010 [Holophaga sp.]